MRRRLLGALLLLAACDRAEAQPAPVPAARVEPLATAPDLPDGWQPIPEIADAAVQAAIQAGGAAVRVGGQAWGDPAMGCYALVLRIEPVGSTSVEALTRALGGLKLTRMAGAGANRYEMLDGGLHGDVTVEVVGPTGGTPRYGAVACLGGDRLPLQCARDCAAITAALAWAP